MLIFKHYDKHQSNGSSEVNPHSVIKLFIDIISVLHNAQYHFLLVSNTVGGNQAVPWGTPQSSADC